MTRQRLFLLALPSLLIASAIGASLKGRIVDTNMVEPIGKDSTRLNITVNDSTDLKIAEDTTFGIDATMLDEMVVVGVVAPIVAKQDTLEYNAGSFRTQQNATVEDLLKKLPGVEVGSDGSVTSGGKSVTKILVDGKEFFADDPTLATKNLTADMIDKVQVIDRKSDLARLTGVDDGEEETVINLSFKKSLNRGWFGNVSAAYGTGNHYEAAANINYFNNGNQISLIAGGNNLNNLGFGDRGRGNFRDFGASGGITSSQRYGINFNVGNEEKFRVGGNVFYSYSDRKSRSRSDTQFLFTDSTSYQNAGQRVRDRGHNIRADLRLQWKIDPYNTLDFRPRFSWSSRNAQLNDSTFLFAGDEQHSQVNATRNSKNNHGSSVSASGEFIYNHTFRNRPGRSFSFTARYNYSDTRQHTLTWSDLVYYLQQNDSEQLYRYLDSDQSTNTAGGRLTWTEPLGEPSRGNFLQLSYNLEYKWSDADKNTYNLPFLPDNPYDLPVFNNVPDGASWDSSLSNSFRNRYYTHEIQLGYKKVSQKYNLEAGVIFTPSGSKSTDLIDPDRNIPLRTVFNVAPFANLRYKFSKTSSISARYRARTSQPSLSALQPVADESDPMNVVVGNPELKPTFTQTLMAHFNSFNTATQTSVMAMLHARMSLNNVTQKMTTDPLTGARTTTYTNTNGNWNLMGMGMWSTTLRNKAWRLNARLMANFSTTPGYINGDYNRSSNLMLSPTFGATFNIDILQVTLNPAYSFQMTASSLPQQKNRYVHNGGFDANAVLQLPFGLEISTDYSFRTSSGYSDSFNNTTNLWNAQISYSILSDRSLTFSVRAYDLLGQSKNISRSISADRIVDSEYNDLTRYVMFGVAWNFNTIKKKTAPNMPPEFEHDGPRPGHRPPGPPMGPPPGRP